MPNPATNGTQPARDDHSGGGFPEGSSPGDDIPELDDLSYQARMVESSYGIGRKEGRGEGRVEATIAMVRALNWPPACHATRSPNALVQVPKPCSRGSEIRPRLLIV